MEANARPRDLPWLKECHNNIWNRQDLEPKLFRTVEVTRSHYDALQARLNEKYPGRDLPQHNGRLHNVSSDKLEILRARSATPVSKLAGFEIGGGARVTLRHSYLPGISTAF